MIRARLTTNFLDKILLGVRGLLFTGLVLGSSGCGIIYTSTTQPLVTNMRATPRGITKGTGSTKLVTLPTAPVNLSAGWSSRAIGEAAARANLKEIYYADVHTLSILLGLWEKKTVEVYGR